MALDPKAVRDLYKSGDMRPTGIWIVCAEVSCESPADHDIRHRCDDGQIKYVPLCDAHIKQCPTEAIEYRTIDHGFVGGPHQGGRSGDPS